MFKTKSLKTTGSFAINKAGDGSTSHDKYSRFGLNKRSWKSPENPLKTPNCVATNTTGDGPTSHDKKILLWSQQIRMEVS